MHFLKRDSHGLKLEAALPTDRYWATIEAGELPGIVRMLGTRYWEQLGKRGLLDLWKRSERTYYGLDEAGGWKNSAAVQFVGSDNETVMARINHYRSIGQGILAMAGHERPAFEARAKDDRTAALKEAPHATGMVNQLWRDLKLEQRTAQDDEDALLYGVGFLHAWWDPHAGKQAADPTRPDLKEGDVRAESVRPWRVLHDITNTEELMWSIVARDVNAWEMAARYPEHADAIVASRGINRWPQSVWMQPWAADYVDREDMVTEWHVHHKPTAAVPQGRYSVVVGDVVLYDGPALLPDGVPVIPMVPARRAGDRTPYSGMWDLLVLQELYDAAVSAISTAVDAYGVQSVAAPENSGVIPEDLASGRRLVYYSPQAGIPGGGKPEPLQLLDLPNIVTEWPGILQSMMETLSGLNSVARGEPDSNLKSGAALALVQSLAVQFNSWFQSARILHREQAATALYRMVKRWMVSPRDVLVSGAGQSEYVRKVTRDNLEGVDAVTIEVGSPLMNQPAGRLEIADKLLAQPGMIKTPDEYIRIITTGRLDPMLKATESQLNTLAQENDMLQRGQMPTVRAGQDHATHVREHQALMGADVDPRVAQMIEAHCADHYTTWSQMPQDLAALTGQSVMPPPPPMPVPGAATKPPPGPDAPPAPDAPEPPAPGRARPMGGPSDAKQPLMPINPATGQRAPVGPGAPPTPV